MNQGKIAVTALSFMHGVKARVFRLVGSLFSHMERHRDSGWFQTCQMIWRRSLKVLCRILPRQRATLEKLAWALLHGRQAGGMTPDAGSSRAWNMGTTSISGRWWPDPLEALAARAVPEFGPSWLHVERSSLVEVSRHLGVGWVDWQSLPVVRDEAPGAVTPQLDALLARFAALEISHILILPWLQQGGADKAALAYLDVLGRYNQCRALVITTENVDSPWLELVPPGTQVMEWAKLEQWSDKESSLNGLLRLVATVRPHVLHVINSFLGWQLLSRHGLRLRALSRLYVSLFWYGPSEPGLLRGYASEFLPVTYRYLDGILTDNVTFGERLCSDYGYEPERCHAVYHPTETILDEVAPTPSVKGVAKVLWAGRFAPEKRLDVLGIIAAGMPHLEFHLFGDASNLPVELTPTFTSLRGLGNVVFQGAYDGFDAIPSEAFDVFLYTSSSDGMPNVVIEALAHGLPVVAPAVGGIGELIDAETGWMIDRYDDGDAYIAAIEEVLGNREEAVRRSRNGLKQVRERHTRQAFLEQLKRVPGYLTQ